MQHQENPYQNSESFEEFFSEAEKRPHYWEERAKLEFTREVVDVMAKNQVSRTDLANRLNVRPGMITRLLSGRNNFEMSTMVRLALALNCRFRSHLHPVEVNSMWIDVLNEEPKPQNIIPWNPKAFERVESSEVTCDENIYVPIAVNS